MAKTATLEQAVRSASQLLRESKSPLICGLDQLSTEAPASFLEKLRISQERTIDTTFTKPRTLKYFFPFKKTGKGHRPRLEKSKGRSGPRHFFGFVILKSLTPRLLERINPQDTNRSQRILVVGDQENRDYKKLPTALSKSPQKMLLNY